mgnify:CR=1 FL=1
MNEFITLGKTDMRVSALGIGAWQWGDRYMWGYGGGYGDADLRRAFELTLEAGINFIDTAEIYGPHTSERKLGEFLRTRETKPIIATKFFPLPLALGARRCAARVARQFEAFGIAKR